MINEDKKIKKPIIRRKLTEKFVATIMTKAEVQIFNMEKLLIFFFHFENEICPFGFPKTFFFK